MKEKRYEKLNDAAYSALKYRVCAANFCINEKFGHLAKEGTGVKFDYIVGNPPYQINDGGGTGSSAKSVYQLFSDISKNLATVHCLVQPARWMVGGRGLMSIAIP